MEPFDPPEARSANSYNWGSCSLKPLPLHEKRARTKKFLHCFVLAVLTGAVIGLLYVNWYEAQVIAKQRHLIFEMWDFIQAGCPTSMLQ